jgi:prephenate dehydrogenase
MTERSGRITIVGCGLIGASFALAMRRAEASVRLAGWDSSPNVLDEALGLGVIDEIDDAFASSEVSSSDLVYLAMPVGAIIEFLTKRGHQFKPDALITDAGSTKEEVCRVALEHLPRGRRFVGGHPVAGSHLRGLENARADLFDGAPYVLTPIDDEPVTTVAEMLERLGAHVKVMTPIEHDRAMALVSHVPQLVSNAIAATVNSQHDAANLIGLSGSGYRDMTRLAASPWSVWRDIFATNHVQVAASLDTLLESLAAVRDELRDKSNGTAGDLKAAGALFELSRELQQLNEDSR